ncbi:hypothetical protein K9N68_11985 [Kovacikia minuta CCNUW1]|uniref:hypothetical protein n=1 Tax=Kovacikia minuta TaxID=2931930 RepID=UPI001CCF1084|nr:hypothetical protein [Kovacikia minuta]UBF28526.1 hypothetical protein K9N68_11985 [Kovacikia minuta CCNUW1]
MTQADLDALLERVDSSQTTQADKQFLRQLLLANGHKTDEQATPQADKYKVDLPEAQNVHIGDRIYQGLSLEELKDVLATFQEKDTSDSALESNVVSNGHLGKITLDFQTVAFINLRLEALEELQKSRQISEAQADELALLKRKVAVANELDRELKEIEIIAERILENAIFTLTLKIQNLRRESDQELSGIHEIVNLEHRAACLEKQLQLVKKFETSLSFGKQGAAWLSSNISEFTKIIGKYAISQSIEIQETASEDEIEDFYFSVEQFLERISHCLTWGRYSMLDSFDIPLIFDAKIYETAFSFFRETIIPPHLLTEVRKQLEDHVDYLIKRLPLYPQ